MTSFHVRPRFRKNIKVSLEALKKEIMQEIAKSDACFGSEVDNHIVIKIPKEEQHYWSPQLSLSLEEEEGGTLIRGLYGPAPNVWALFAFGYGAFSVLGLFHLIIGFSIFQMDKGSTVLWLASIEPIMILLLYIAAQMGQKKGAEQLYRLHFFFEGIVHEKMVIE